jgi:exosortase
MSGVELPDNRAAGSAHGALALLSAHARSILIGAVVLGCFGFCYADVFRVLYHQLSYNQAYSYGFLIPPVSLYVLWVRRDRLVGLHPEPAWFAGLLVLLSSLGTLLVGRLVGIVTLQEVSVVGSLLGLVLLFVGWRGLRVVWFPIVYLIFMMPVWDVATEPLYPPLQRFAAGVGAKLLALIGVPVFQDGMTLHLPNTSVEVAEGCSGINSLLSLLVVGIVLAYLSLRGTWRRLAIICVAVAAALLTNPLRVALITYCYYAGITTPAQSHMWQGMVVSLGTFAVLFVVAEWLAEGEPRPSVVTHSPVPRLEVPTKLGRGVWVAIVACILLLGAGMLRQSSLPASSLGRARLELLPLELGPWRALDERPAVPAGFAVKEDEVWREYRKETGQAVLVYVGRFAYAEEGAVKYWSDRFSKIAADSIDTGESGALRVSAGLTDLSGRSTPVLFWYQAGRTATTNRAIAKLHTLWGTVVGSERPTLAVVFLDAAGNPDSASTLASMKDLAGRIARFAPGAVAPRR